MLPKEKVLVHFKNIEDRYCIDRKSMRIEYVMQKEFKPSSKDWIGIFPRGWREFEQMILCDYIHPRTVESPVPKIIFELFFKFSDIKITCSNADYQLVYVSRELQVLGRSSYFKLYKTSEIEECTVYEGSGTADVKQSSAIGFKGDQSPEVLVPPNTTYHFKQKWEEIGREQSPKPNRTINQTFTVNPGRRFQKTWRNNAPPHVANFQKNYAAAKCDFCQQTNELIKEKQALCSQVKDLAQCNYELRNVQDDLQNKLEIAMVVQSTMKLHICRLNKEKEDIENFVKQLMENLQGYLAVCVDDKGNEIMVQRVHPEMERQLIQYTARPQNERYLKAIIGNQEKKIQELTARLMELELQAKGIDPETQMNRVDEDGRQYLNLESEKRSNNKKALPWNESIKNDTVVSPPVKTVVEVHRATNQQMKAIICDLNNNGTDTIVEENDCKEVRSDEVE